MTDALHIHCSPILDSQDKLNKPTPLKDEWIGSGELCNHRKEGGLPFAAIGAELEIITLSKMSQVQKDEYSTIPLIHGS